MPESRRRDKIKTQAKKMPTHSVQEADSENPQKPNLPQQASLQVLQHYQGVIPHPEMMEHYARINPTFPERIMQWAEDEAKHRRANERFALRMSIVLDVVGNISGLLSVVAMVWLCYQYLLKGAPADGKEIAIGVIVALASVFVLRKAYKKITEPRGANTPKNKK